MYNSRRSFIKHSSILLASTALLPSFSFGASGRQNEKLAIQLYCVDKEMNEDAIGTLKALKAIGYQYVEHADYRSRTFYGFSPADFGNLVTDSGLTLLSGHTVLEPKHWNTGTKTFTKEWHYTIEDARTAGQLYLISPWIDRNLWNNEKGFKQFMGVFNKSGELCKTSGLKFGYHNHDFEFSNVLNGVRLYDIILQQTDPNVVSQQLDIGNIYQKGFSITGLFLQYPGRFSLIHVKDIIQSKERHQPFKSVPIGEGILDIKEIIGQARKQGGTKHFIIEQNQYMSTTSFNCLEQNYHAFNNMNTDKVE